MEHQAAEVTIEEMVMEAELFRRVYPDLIGEIDRVERTRGKLNDFQLMLAVAHAKNGLGVLSYERRQVINSIFALFTTIYRKNGRYTAEKWAVDTFGVEKTVETREDLEEVAKTVKELTELIEEKENELLQIYREYYLLKTYLEEEEKKLQTENTTGTV
ncbi:hypothetical protein [Paenibacillus gansuensis]|uniref:Uncharacterized protein n=1 Tax=Paenibacillus gansuensis TaxID=306542 RepID=A0ABW5PF42_9BACL